MTEDHSASAPVERARVCAAGGMVCNDPNEGPGALPRVFTTSGKGGLAVTRALGDAFLKNVPGRAPVAASSLVLATPDVAHLSLCLPGAVGGRPSADGEEDVAQFMILASDGLWDVFTDQGAVAWVARALRTHCKVEEEGEECAGAAGAVPPRKPTPCNAAAAEAAAASLVDEAYNRGSADNITAIVVLFGGCHPSTAPAVAAGATDACTRVPSPLTSASDRGPILRRSSASRKAL